MSSRFLGNSYCPDHVYIASTGTVCGPLEFQGPLGTYFDKSYNDYHCGEDSFEKAERRMLRDALDICLKREQLRYKDIDLFIGSDMLNQNTTVHYLAREIPKPFIGIYGACSSFTLSMILCSLMIDADYIEKATSLVVSHNASAERQYRYPVEYGVQKKETCTFTATGAIATLLTNQPSPVRIESITLGRVIDYRQTNPNDMGRAMAPAA